MIAAWALERAGVIPIESGPLALLVTVLWAAFGVAAALTVAYSDYNWLRRMLGREEVRRGRFGKRDGVWIAVLRFIVFVVLLALIAPLSAGPPPYS